MATIEPASQYPNQAWFSAGGRTAAFNPCHFYGGATTGVPVDHLGVATLCGELPVLDESARVVRVGGAHVAYALQSVGGGAGAGHPDLSDGRR